MSKDHPATSRGSNAPNPRPAQKLTAKLSLQLLAVFCGVLGVILGGKGLSGLATGEISYDLKPRRPPAVLNEYSVKEPIVVAGTKAVYAGLSLLALGTSVSLIGILFWFTAESRGKHFPRPRLATAALAAVILLMLAGVAGMLMAVW